MKKIITISALLLLVFALASCGFDNEDTGTLTYTDDIVTVTDVDIAVNPAGLLTDFKSQTARVNWPTNANKLFVGCLNGDKMIISSVRHLPIFKFETKDELDRFLQNTEDVFEFDDGYGGKSFGEMCETYDDEFFKENTLILVYVESGSGSFRFGIKEIYRSETALCVYIERTDDSYAYTDDMASWFISAEIKKSDISGCTEFDAQDASVEKINPCSEIMQLPGMTEYGAFSFSEVKENTDTSKANVKTDGFANKSEIEPINPIDRAKEEVTVDYNLIQTFYDEKEGIWKVHFFNSNDEKEDQTVYLNARGRTLLVVYGE